MRWRIGLFLQRLHFFIITMICGRNVWLLSLFLVSSFIFIINVIFIFFFFKKYINLLFFERLLMMMTWIDSMRAKTCD